MSQLSIIFDLDGTLLDTLADLAETCNKVLAEHRFPVHPEDAYRHFVGDGLWVLMERIIPEGTERSVVETCCTMFIESYARNWKKNSCPYDGIPEMLTALQKKGIELAVLSNKPHIFTQLFVDEFFPKGLFSFVYGQREGVPKKPDPTVALEIAAKLRTGPHKTLFVGDTGVDIQTGKAAGMITAGVSWGFRGEQELVDNNADLIVKSPLELLNYAISCT
jgi:phosphoglycolate phosphatase